MPDGGAPVTPISKAGVPFPAGTEADPLFVEAGAGGGAATIGDGADVTQGAIADAAAAAGAAGTVSAKLRRLTTDLDAVLAKLNASIAVTGTFFQATQPVSGTFFQATQPVSGTFWQATQPVSGPQTNAEFLAALRSGTATPTNVSSQTAAITILASNAARKGGKIINTDANALYLVYQAFGAGTPSATNYYEVLATGDDHVIDSGYTGEIAGAWAADGAGKAMVWEIT